MTKYEKKKLDCLWQEIITKGKTCSYPRCCKMGVEGHHIFKRRYLNTRWKVENGRALCREHHDYVEKHPTAYEDLIIEQLGQNEWDRLRQEALMVKKQYYDEILKELEGRL